MERCLNREATGIPLPVSRIIYHMKPKPDENLPELLRKRILRQRKRLKFVRFSFALTVVLSVVLLFVANQTQNLAPNARTTSVIAHPNQLWLLDQQLDLTPENAEQTGSFALARADGDEITKGTAYDGIVRSVTVISESKIGITTSSRFMLFDVSGTEWERTELRSLGLNDPTASPVVVYFRETLWLCWVHGSDIKVRPFDRPEVEPKSLHKTNSPGATLQVEVTRDAIWLGIAGDRGGDLTLVSFTPGIEIAPQDPPADSDADEAPDNQPDSEPETSPDSEVEKPVIYRTTVQRHFSSEVTANLRGSSFTVLGTAEAPRPVVAISRKDDSSRGWHMMVWTRDESSQGKWIDASAPARAKPASGLEITNFMSLSADGDTLRAVYSEAGKVKTAQTKLGADGSLEWSEPTELALDKTVGPTAYIVWVTVLFAMLLVMASQGVWLLLNRERTMDRTLAEIVEKKAESPAAAPKLLYANAMGRALALLLDIAITSPVIILLQGIYSYSWEQAYGFLALGSVAAFDASLVPTLVATLVTLLVLSIYSMVCELIWGRTFGKALFRLRVVDADGEAPAGWRIVVRNLFKVVELIHWLVLLIPMGVMMVSAKQQRLGDILAGTYVIVDVVPEEAPDDIDI
ncbi:MAG: RDD family protein [Planctomycetes bacterium]|nr:RDD family protein [Planctomycetota bacterium]